MTDAHQAADIFQQAAQLNREDSLRDGALLRFPHFGQLVMTGDLHGHRRNFDKLLKYCDLQHAAARHVLLHEIVHQDVDLNNGQDDSHLVLLEAARWKCEYPEQVHFLQSNHELAQLNRHEITKNGRVVVYDFERCISETYGDGATRVIDAIDAYLASLPLAARTENRIFLSHSLPTPAQLPMYDASVVFREPTRDDLADYGSAYLLVWGRYQTTQALETLADLYDVDLFICGHQPQDTGFEILHDRMVILASDHNHGVFLPVNLSKTVNIETLERAIRPFAGVL